MPAASHFVFRIGPFGAITALDGPMSDDEALRAFLSATPRKGETTRWERLINGNVEIIREKEGPR